MEHDQGDVEIVVHYRAILLFTSDSEEVPHRVHQAAAVSRGADPRAANR